MFALHHLLRRSAGALALVLAFAVMLSSLCPRGWFICMHDEAFVLVDGHHANADKASRGDHACGDHACGDRASGDRACGDQTHPADESPTVLSFPADAPAGVPVEDSGCLDFALSFVLDDLVVALPIREDLPHGPVLASLPDLTAAAVAVCVPWSDMVGGPPPLLFVIRIRLLV